MKKRNSCPPPTDIHPDHGAEHARLNRIVGQIEGIRRMIDERRYCPEILGQVAAARAALQGLAASLLERHLSHCVNSAMSKGQDTKKAVNEVVEIFRKYSE